jgi:hypothetical protein
MVKCNDCKYNGNLKFKGNCPVCSSKDIQEMNELEISLKNARSLIDQNALAVSQLGERSKARWAKLREVSRC